MHIIGWGGNCVPPSPSLSPPPPSQHQQHQQHQHQHQEQQTQQHEEHRFPSSSGEGTQVNRRDSGNRVTPIPSHPTYTPEQWQLILQLQQQRLLNLRHASKCTHVEGQCPQADPNCNEMKELWKHIAMCREQKCSYLYCISSRYVVYHYHKCKNPDCAVCGPVRSMILYSRKGLPLCISSRR